MSERRIPWLPHQQGYPQFQVELRATPENDLGYFLGPFTDQQRRLVHPYPTSWQPVGQSDKLDNPTSWTIRQAGSLSDNPTSWTIRQAGNLSDNPTSWQLVGQSLFAGQPAEVCRASRFW